jgi:hypothetical protein
LWGDAREEVERAGNVPGVLAFHEHVAVQIGFGF